MPDEQQSADRAQLIAQLDALVATIDAGQPADPAAHIVDPSLRALAAQLSSGPSPRASLLSARRLLDASTARPLPTQPRALRALGRVIASGPALTRMLVQQPERIEQLASPQLGRPVRRDELAEELDYALDEVAGGEERSTLDDEQVAEVIAAFRNDHFVRLAALEFGDTPLEQVGRELSDLADVCLEAALRQALAAESRRHGAPQHREPGDDKLHDTGVVALAMGKYGARELNFCSDIDIIFVYESDDGATSSGRSLHELFVGVCRRTTGMLSQTTREGAAFRVDLRLRPEGDQGPLCNSLASAERYYETWGGPYDRLAWLKARPAAGDVALGEELMRTMRPFVFPRAINHAISHDIRELTRRIRAELREHSGMTPGWNVKLGRGGIRDVEFFVQALQLVHAGKQPSLQEPSTLAALDRLLFAALITDRERADLGEAYDLYRRIEHRLQLHSGNQTHLLPDAGPLREHVIAHLGYEPADFAATLERHRERVGEIFDTLAGDEAGARHGGDEDELASHIATLLDIGVDKQAALAALAALGLAEPEQALSKLRTLQSKPWGPFGSAPSPAARRIARPLLKEIVESPDPDAALVHVVELSLRFGARNGLWRLLDENPAVIRLLASLFGTSDYLARLLTSSPELIDRLLLSGQLAQPRSSDDMRASLRRRLAEVDDDDTEHGLETLCRFQGEELLRIGLSDIAGASGDEAVWRQLSDLADALLGELYPLVLGEMTRRYGAPLQADGTPARLSVLALGKLGAHEMTYGSDVDLIFVYSGAGTTQGARQLRSREFFSRLGHRFIRALSARYRNGRLYDVDTRLRPSGEQGTLVVSKSAFLEHHDNTRDTWERQVLIKLRAVAGDAQLGAELEAARERLLFSAVAAPGDDDGAADEQQRRAKLRGDVLEMRERIEQALAQENHDFYNLKLGRGGLLDVEFIAQYLQLAHGRDEPGLRVRATVEALEAAQAAGVIDGEHCAALVDGYMFLRRLESRLRIVRDRSAARLPRAAAALEVVARRLGYRVRPEGDTSSVGAQLLDHYKARTAEIRGVFEELLA